MAFITWSHHALISGERKDAIVGGIFTILLAIFFTALQYAEYLEAPFTMADGVFGSTFFASTGLHGFKIVPIKTNFGFVTDRKYINTLASLKKDNLAIKFNNSKEAKQIILESSFVEWFTGFVDAEGNFNITLRKFNVNSYTNAMLTFQIGLHINDLPILEYIKNKLSCGKISISGNKCNYFINVKDSLLQILLPIFKFKNLNSSKYYQFFTF